VRCQCGLHVLTTLHATTRHSRLQYVAPASSALASVRTRRRTLAHEISDDVLLLGDIADKRFRLLRSMLPFRGLSVCSSLCLSRSCIMLKRLKISAHFLWRIYDSLMSLPEFHTWKIITNQIEDRIAQCEAKITSRIEPEHTRANACGLNDEDWPCLGCSYTSKPVDQGKVREIIKEAVNQQQEEDKEVEARRNNLVLYNIPENQSEKRDETKS